MSGSQIQNNPFTDALINGDTETLDRIAEDSTVAVSTDTFLDAVAAYPIATVEWLIAQGVSVTVHVDDGFPAMHLAVDRDAKDRYDVVRLLVKAGVDVNERGMNDWTPLHRAAARDDVEMVQLLLDLGADPEQRTHIDDNATPEQEARLLGKTRSADVIRAWVTQRK